MESCFPKMGVNHKSNCSNALQPQARRLFQGPASHSTGISLGGILLMIDVAFQQH